MKDLVLKVANTDAPSVHDVMEFRLVASETGRSMHVQTRLNDGDWRPVLQFCPDLADKYRLVLSRHTLTGPLSSRFRLTNNVYIATASEVSG